MTEIKTPISMDPQEHILHLTNRLKTNKIDKDNLEDSLMDLLHIATFYRHKMTIQWIKNELSCYENLSELPKYRKNYLWVYRRNSKDEELSKNWEEKHFLRPVKEIIIGIDEEDATFSQSLENEEHKVWTFNETHFTIMVTNITARITEYLAVISSKEYTTNDLDAVFPETATKENILNKFRSSTAYTNKTSSIPIDFWSEINTEISKVSRKLFEEGHIAEAVEAALKEVNDSVKQWVKKETGKELDGVSLMHEAFNEKNPIIKLMDLNTESGRNIQQGYHLIFAGAISGIRNPCAHSNLQMSRREGAHKIFIASDLMNMFSNRNWPPRGVSWKDEKCPLCGVYFSKQGLNAHLYSCRKKHPTLHK